MDSLSKTEGKCLPVAERTVVAIVRHMYIENTVLHAKWWTVPLAKRSEVSEITVYSTVVTRIDCSNRHGARHRNAP